MQERLYDNVTGPTSPYLSITRRVEDYIERVFRDNDDYSALELMALCNEAVVSAFHKVSITRRLCEHKNLPEDDDYCEECSMVVKKR